MRALWPGASLSLPAAAAARMSARRETRANASGTSSWHQGAAASAAPNLSHSAKRPRPEMAQPPDDYKAIRKREASGERFTMNSALMHARRANNLIANSVPECPPPQCVMASPATIEASDVQLEIHTNPRANVDDNEADMDSTEDAMMLDTVAVSPDAGEFATMDTGHRREGGKEPDSSSEDEFALADRLRADDLRMGSRADYQKGFTAHCSADNRFYPTQMAARAMEIEIEQRNIRAARGHGQGPDRSLITPPSRE